MKRLHLVLLSVVLLVAGLASAQTPARVRGIITAIDGNMLSVKSRGGKDLKIETGPDATIVALELHRSPAGRPVPSEGRRPWDLEPNSTMTNGMVTAMVEAGNGREHTLSYKDGAQRVVVPANIPIVTSRAGDRSLLVVGEYAFIAATVAADGRMTAQRLQVGKDGVRPPQ